MPPHIDKVRLLIHGWELPSFPKAELRSQTARALRHVLEHSPDLHISKAVIDFDELRPERPRDPEELARWHTAVRDPIDMEFDARGGGDQDSKLELAQAIRPIVARLTYFVLRKYVEADAWNRERQKRAAMMRRMDN